MHRFSRSAFLLLAILGAACSSPLDTTPFPATTTPPPTDGAEAGAPTEPRADGGAPADASTKPVLPAPELCSFDGQPVAPAFTYLNPFPLASGGIRMRGNGEQIFSYTANAGPGCSFTYDASFGTVLPSDFIAPGGYGRPAHVEAGGRVWVYGDPKTPTGAPRQFFSVYPTPATESCVVEVSNAEGGTRGDDDSVYFVEGNEARLVHAHLATCKVESKASVYALAKGDEGRPSAYRRGAVWHLLYRTRAQQRIVAVDGDTGAPLGEKTIPFTSSEGATVHLFGCGKDDVCVLTETGFAQLRFTKGAGYTVPVEWVPGDIAKKMGSKHTGFSVPIFSTIRQGTESHAYLGLTGSSAERGRIVRVSLAP
ncbi:MAG: hypothetical protein JST00_45735 [Deltaproteobacteria bacterium]|nr:hypothetical protein [Deltaproteobacteria bacterium]